MATETFGNADDAHIQKIVTKHADKGALACKRAFEAAESLGVAPAVIGRCADDMGIKLVACQLGLFGYKPEKKIVKPAHPVSPVLESEIEKELDGGRLPCSAAFGIANRMGLKKMDVSAACEALDVRIKLCQLGAF